MADQEASARAGPSGTNLRTRTGRTCKRKVSYDDQDDLLSLILGECGLQGEKYGEESGTEEDLPPKRKKRATKNNVQSANVKTGKKETKNATHQMTTWMDKKSFMSMVNALKTVAIGDVKDYVVVFLRNEKHIEVHAPRKDILDRLTSTAMLDILVKYLFAKCQEIMTSCFKQPPKDRQSSYRINYIFHVKAVVQDKSSEISKWFLENFTEDISQHLYSVVHAVAAGVFEFTQSHFLKMNKEKETREALLSDRSDHKPTNSTESLLTLAGGCFGKIYKCIKKSIKKLRKENYEKNKEKWRSNISFRKFLYQLVMSQKEKKNPNIPKPLIERDRGWLFIPKWVFLPYLRVLDHCISHTAHQNGLRLYGNNLIKVRVLSY